LLLFVNFPVVEGFREHIRGVPETLEETPIEEAPDSRDATFHRSYSLLSNILVCAGWLLDLALIEANSDAAHSDNMVV
jgi:hypothetical protein